MGIIFVIWSKKLSRMTGGPVAGQASSGTREIKASKHFERPES
jgi:hypothetical protein